MTNSPVNHVGMTVAIDDLPPLIWHAELGDKLTDMWTGSNHRGVQLNDARQAVERWIHNYGQRCWLRQLTPYATREQEDRLLRVIARMDGTPFPITARLTARWFRGRVPTANDWTRGIPVVDSKVRESARAQEGREAQSRAWRLRTAPRRSPSPTRRWVCSTTEKHFNWFDPGKFWSGDVLHSRPAISSATRSPSWRISGRDGQCLIRS